MYSKLKNSVFTKIIWGLMGLYLLNISVDAADPNPQYIAEDLSFNDQESIIEIIVEKVLGFEDAIDEHDDCDTEDFNNSKNVKIDFLIHQFLSKNSSVQLSLKKKNLFINHNATALNGFKEIDSPPPKV